MNSLDQIPVPKRYIGPEMAGIWSEETRYRNWAAVEFTAAKAQGAPSEVITAMTAAAVPTPDQVAAEEARSGHDVVAFLAAWKNGMDPAAHGWVHRGMTSSDLVDSALALTVINSEMIIHRHMDRFIRTMVEHSLQHRKTLRVARTHGQIAEVSTWGYRVADITHMAVRAHSHLRSAARAAGRPKMSGPVGDYKHVTREQELAFAQLLIGPEGRPPMTATQVVARDSLADLVFACAQAASVIETLALEVRLSMQSEVGELAEGDAANRVGSSAMPHKRNPITSENLTGLARLVRAQVGPMLEDVALYHERDISHSSVERVALPTALIVLDHMVVKATDLIANLQVNTDKMLDNVYRFESEINSATARTWLVRQGLDPDTAWSLVKEAFDNYNRGLGIKFHRDVTSTARMWIRTGKITDENFPEFNPNWVDLQEACDFNAQISGTRHVFDYLARMIGRDLPEN